MESRALLIHRDATRNAVDVVLHNVLNVDGRYALAAGKVIDDKSLSDLINILSGTKINDPDILPQNILISDPRLVCWWRKAEEADFVYKVGTSAKRIRVNYPTLIFFAMGGRLMVAASKETKRPTNDTALFYAPVMCMDSYLEICTGNMTLPDVARVSNIDQYESFFYDGANTHLNVNTIKSCNSADKFIEFYKKNGNKPFPKSELVSCYKTFGTFVRELLRHE